MNTNIFDFADAARAQAGLIIEQPEPDGQIHRVHIAGDKRGTKNGYYVLHESRNCLRAFFGDWKTNQTFKWNCANYEQTTFTERQRFDREIDAYRAKRKAEQKRAEREAADHAATIVSQCYEADPNHPYIVEKGLITANLKQHGDNIVIPLCDTRGMIHSVQTIYPDGSKRFLKNGAIKGHFWLCAAESLPSEGRLFICEGAATALSIYATTGEPVAAAMNAGNLEAVAIAIRHRKPDLEVIIMADNDHHLDYNIGLEKARDAAGRAMCRYLVAPVPCSLPDCKCTDFNDAMTCTEAEL
ncbi:hypothetical protein A3762_06660 [Oleiphilus sp. HI0125]|uniref:toprim domain-containing protein n=1 Tax=Oleiphilus sp. HI0125 TaxID=1822266 RepID=UPI0007C2E16F|nr:toprim domain-containing protein [Oleiphilus sp. HI0125]KZZ58849.1 hypothetical protein A3762_06660 [Oleiphilus sp. HI0125]